MTAMSPDDGPLLDETTASSDEGPQLGLAFQLPQHVRDDPDMVSIFTNAVTKLKAESVGIPMHTVQEFLLERIATKYVMMKWREIHGWSGLGVNAERDATTQWLDMVKEWNRVLAAGHEQMRDAVLRDAEKIALAAVEKVEDPETRKMLLRHFKEAYAAKGY